MILYRIGWLLSRIIFRGIFRIRRYGQENIPKEGPFIIASNHKSLADPPLVGSYITRPVNFLAKRELFKNPIFGWIISRTRAHPIRRGVLDKSVIELVERLLAKGEGVVIFPEGTRARKTDFLEPKPGIGIIARRTQVPIVPAYIHNSHKLKEGFRGKEKLAVIYGEPLDKSVISQYDESKSGYRELTEEIMRRIKGLREDFLRRFKLSPNEV